jgi:hypothetical protein
MRWVPAANGRPYIGALGAVLLDAEEEAAWAV